VHYERTTSEFKSRRPPQRGRRPTGGHHARTVVMRVRFSPVPLFSGTLRGFQTSREGARRAKPGGSPRGWGHRPAGGRQTGSLETRVQFPVTPPWATRRARAGLQNQPCRVRVPGCLQQRATMAGPWPGRKPVRALGLSVRFRRSLQRKTNAAGPRTALKAVGTLGSGDRVGSGELCSTRTIAGGFGNPPRVPSTIVPSVFRVWKVNAAGPRTASKADGAFGLGVRFARLLWRVARTVRGRFATPKPVVMSPEQVRLLHSLLIFDGNPERVPKPSRALATPGIARLRLRVRMASWPRGKVPVCNTGHAGSIPAEVSEQDGNPERVPIPSRVLAAAGKAGLRQRDCAQGVSGCTPDRQSEGAGSTPAGRSRL
jgi:hypothetical protein